MRVGVHDHFKGPSPGLEQSEEFPAETFISAAVYKYRPVAFGNENAGIHRTWNIPGRTFNVKGFQRHQTTSVGQV
jgi:hypothetical protein